MTELSEFDQMGFRVTLKTRRGEEPYDINLADFSAKDEFDFQREVGLTFFEAFQKMSAYVIAGFVWLLRRKYGEPRLTFDEVAKEVKFGALGTIEFTNQDDEEKPDDEFSSDRPESSGGPSESPSLGSPLSTG